MYSASVGAGSLDRIYPEREEARLGKVDRLAATMGGLFAPWLRPRPARFRSIVEKVNTHGRDVEVLSDSKILEEARSLRPRLRSEGFTADLVARVFSLVREAGRRALDMPHLDVQLMGGSVLLNCMAAEMETGEGKTLTATLPACTLALGGVPVHIITVNDYLAKRDSDWMRPIYNALGISVGTIVHGMDHAARREAYRCDVTYCTNKEVAFDYLRDRIVLWDRPTPIRLQVERLYRDKSRLAKLVMRGLHFAIVDEADSVLIDEARTPLIISSEGETLYDASVCQHAIGIGRSLVEKEHYTISKNERTVKLTRRGKERVKDFDWEQVGLRMSEEQQEELVRQSLVALYLFSRDKHYLIKDGKIQIIDEYTGRLMPDRSWERGLHQLLEVKEDCEVTRHKETHARISYQRFFRRYLGLSGMTGTAREVAGELWSIYRMRVVTIPTNRPIQRKGLPDRVHRTSGEKWAAVADRVSDMNGRGRPVLVGTRSVEASEHLSLLLERMNLPHRVLNARQNEEEAEIVKEAGRSGRVTVATNMAGRGTDIRLGPRVAEMGGLHVIATERHEARRIDRQLFGRCGRQGDPGTFEAIVSVEDELITVYGGRALRWLTAIITMKQKSVPGQWLGRILIFIAQRAAERLHARMRHDLLRMDEHLADALAFAGRPE